MKKILTIIGVAALLATVTASAQSSPTYAAQSISLPATLATGTSNLASAPILFVGKQGNAAFESTISSGSSGATNVYYFAPSVSGVNFDTNAVDLLAVTNSTASATANTVVKNLSATGIGYYKLVTIVTTGAVTNNSHYYPAKISAP